MAQINFDLAQINLDLAQISLDLAQINLALAQINLDLAQINVDLAQISVPTYATLKPLYFRKLSFPNFVLTLYTIVIIILPDYDVVIFIYYAAIIIGLTYPSFRFNNR